MRLRSLIGLNIVLIAALFLLAKNASASEGRFSLTASGLTCEGISVWDESSYDVTGRCFGLVYPYAERLDTYILWVQDEAGRIDRIAEIEKGIFSGSADFPFTRVFVTAEEGGSYNRQPGSKVIVSGNLDKFAVTDSARLVSEVEVLPTVSPQPKAAGSISRIIPKGILTGVILIALVFAVIYFIIRKG